MSYISSTVGFWWSRVKKPPQRVSPVAEGFGVVCGPAGCSGPWCCKTWPGKRKTFRVGDWKPLFFLPKQCSKTQFNAFPNNFALTFFIIEILYLFTYPGNVTLIRFSNNVHPGQWLYLPLFKDTGNWALQGSKNGPGILLNIRVCTSNTEQKPSQRMKCRACSPMFGELFDSINVGTYRQTPLFPFIKKVASLYWKVDDDPFLFKSPLHERAGIHEWIILSSISRIGGWCSFTGQSMSPVLIFQPSYPGVPPKNTWKSSVTYPLLSASEMRPVLVWPTSSSTSCEGMCGRSPRKSPKWDTWMMSTWCHETIHITFHSSF